MPKVTLWVPAAESPRWPCVLSWLNLTYPDGVRPEFVRSGANNIKYSWNKVVRDFLKTDSDYLWSCHNDVVFLPDTLNRLLSWGKPLVSGLIFMRQGPVVPHIWQKYIDCENYAYRLEDTRKWFYDRPNCIKFGPQIMEPRPDDALAEVGFTSTSCTLIHRSVLEAMADPWFLWDDDYNGGGEDRRFFENARAAGFIPYVDRSCIVGHLVGDIATGPADFIAWDQVSDFSNTGEPGNDNK
jgi:hypothetical protein